MTETEHVPEQGEWTTIGQVGTDTGTLAIVAPEQACELAVHWQAFVDKLISGWGLPSVRPQFEQLKVGRRDSWGGQTLVVEVFDDGIYDVEAQFCDRYGSGHLSVCELRIRIHDHSDDDEEQPAP